MQYADFETEYQQVVLMFRGDRSGMPAAIERLRELASGIDDEDDREEARWDIVALEDALEKGTEEEAPSEVILQARRVFAEADRNDGTPAERVARAERGIRELERIAADAMPEEQARIGALEHTVAMLIGALKPDVR